MKILTTCLAFLICASCVNTPTVFVQDDIRIVLPVQKKDDIELLYNDGGSRGYRLIDAEGHMFEVFFDRGFILKDGQFEGNEPGTIHVKGYFESPSDITIKNQEEFKRVVMKGLPIY